MPPYELLVRLAAVITAYQDVAILVVLWWVFRIDRRLSRVEQHLARLSGELNGHVGTERKIIPG